MPVYQTMVKVQDAHTNLAGNVTDMIEEDRDLLLLDAEFKLDADMGEDAWMTRVDDAHKPWGVMLSSAENALERYKSPSEIRAELAAERGLEPDPIDPDSDPSTVLPPRVENAIKQTDAAGKRAAARHGEGTPQAKRALKFAAEKNRRLRETKGINIGEYPEHISGSLDRYMINSGKGLKDLSHGDWKKIVQHSVAIPFPRSRGVGKQARRQELNVVKSRLPREYREAWFKAAWDILENQIGTPGR